MRHLTATLALALAFGCGPAASPSPVAEPAERAEASAGSEHGSDDARGERPLNVWRVTSAGGQESTLLGTFHIGVELDDALPAPHSARLYQARVVILEMNPADMNPAAIAPLTVLPEDQQLSALLGEPLFEALRARLELPAERLQRLRPWVAVSVVMVSELQAPEETEAAPAAAGEGAGEGPAGLDMQLGALASAGGLPITGLETLTEQAALMNSIPLETHTEYLRSVLMPDDAGSDAPDSSEADAGEEASAPSVQDMRDAYLRGDLEALESFVIDPAQVAAAPAFFERMLFERNTVWLRKLRPELDAGGAFCAVGAGHLLGERGLLSQLEAAGYTVERLHGPALP